MLLIVGRNFEEALFHNLVEVYLIIVYSESLTRALFEQNIVA